MPTNDEETYSVIYAVTEGPNRAALLRLFGQMRNERDGMVARIVELEADSKVVKLTLGVGRWAGPMVVAIAIAIVTLLLGGK